MHRCNVVSIAAACSRCQAVFIDLSDSSVGGWDLFCFEHSQEITSCVRLDLSDSSVGGWDLFCFEHSQEITSCVRFQIVNILSVQLALQAVRI